MSAGVQEASPNARNGVGLASPSLAWRGRVLAPERLVSLTLFAALAVFILFTFDRHGISNDEEVQRIYGHLLLDFYSSGFADRAAFAYKNLYLYGGLFDLVAAVLEPMVPLDPWDLRHLLSAVFGFAGIVGAWRLASLLAGERAGIVAALLLALTGSWSGAMFTHTKDVPFAACMIWSLYYTVRVVGRLPAPGRWDVAGLGLAVGAAFGLRVGAVFAVFYLGVATMIAAWLLAGPGWGRRTAFLARSVRALLPAAAIAFALMAFFWPWSVMGPRNLVEAMTAFSHFAFPLYTILAGQVMPNGEVPGHYLSAYLLVRLPELFLLGLVLAVVFGAVGAARLRGEEGARLAVAVWLPVVLAALFPLAYTLAAAPPLYNGIRHFLFLLPPLAVLAAVGWTRAWEAACVRGGARRWLAAAPFAILTLVHAGSLIALHPYGYVYYNRLVDGVAGAVGRWELDYWSSGLREAVSLLNARVAAERRPGASYRVAVCAEPVQASTYLDPRLTVTKDWREADFFLSTTHMDCDDALGGEVIGEVARAGVTLAVVRDRRHLVGVERAPR